MKQFVLNDGTGKIEHIRVAFNTNKSLVRNDTMGGKDYKVVPVVLLVEGVLNGSCGPILYPADELNKFPLVWNTKPIVLYHPEGRTACDPDILTNRQCGVLMNVSTDTNGPDLRADNGKPLTRLIGEAWLDTDRCNIVDERIMESIENEDMMEVSTGLFLDSDKETGTFNGVEYDSIGRNYKPDHLALLPDMVGASSIKDGAGLCRNSTNNALSYEEIRSSLESALPEMVWVQDFTNDTVIYSKDGKYFKQSYTISDDKVTLSGIAEEVVRRYEYVTINGKRIKNTEYIGKEQLMDRDKIINELVENKRWKEDDRSFLESLKDDQLETLHNRKEDEVIPPVEKKTTEADGEGSTGNADESGSSGEEAPANEGMDMKTLIENADPATREYLMEAERTTAAVRNGLVKRILDSPLNKATKEALANRGLEDLRLIAGFIPKEKGAQELDFSGQAPVNTDNEEEPMEISAINYEEENK